MVENNSIIRALQEIAILMEIKGENPFKIRAYANAARILNGLSTTIKTLVEKNELTEIKGIGKGIADFIKEIITTGKSSELMRLKENIPVGVIDMLRIPGMGPKKVKTVWEELQIKSIGELEYACQENRLLELDGFGKKSQDKILQGIELVKRYSDRRLLSGILETAENLQNSIQNIAGVKQCAIAGSLRRWKETIKNINLVISTSENRLQIIKTLSALPMVESLTDQDNTLQVTVKDGTSAEIEIVSEQQFPLALLYSTGSIEFNVILQSVAQNQGFRLGKNELYQNGTSLECTNEEDIFQKLGMAFIPAELRENRGEIQFAINEQIPQLVEVKDIKGIIHVHSDYSDGIHSIRELALACQKMGYEYLVISDHSKTAAYARGLSEHRIKEQLKEIDSLNQELKNFGILKSIECDILSDGHLDYEEDILSSFDLVIASIHSKFNMTESEATGRLIKAMEGPFTTIIGHPTGRLLLAREGYPVNLNDLMIEAAKKNVALELNANPHRLDLDWRYLQQAKELGIKISINPDAHRIEGITDIRYGVGIARKGWLTRHDVLNCLSSEEILQFARRRRISI